MTRVPAWVVVLTRCSPSPRERLTARADTAGCGRCPPGQAAPKPAPTEPVAPAAPRPATAAPPSSDRAVLQAAIDKLGKLDYQTRVDASATLRRAPAAAVVPMLVDAARGHADGYVRFRALVLLSGFNDPKTRPVFLEALGDENDRLREVAYAYVEDHPDPALVARLLQALEREQAEFVRPALIRAVAAHGADPKVQLVLKREVMRGVDFFRSAVIEALGAHKAVYALTNSRRLLSSRVHCRTTPCAPSD